jgi:hypothetical protein
MFLNTITYFRHLDISQFDDKRGTFLKPNHMLRNLVESLPQVTSAADQMAKIDVLLKLFFYKMNLGDYKFF